MDGMTVAKWVFVGLASYFLGNFSTGIVISRAVAQDDVRRHGSGNTGTTNMFRFLGMKASLLTLLGDMAKAAVASLLGLFMLGREGAIIAGILAVAGHNWPIFYKFRGGKGIAATAGTMLVTQPLLALILVPLALVAIRAVKIVSVISLGAITAYLALTFIFWWGDYLTIVYALVLWAMAFVSHRANIQRILSGEEKKNSLDFGKRR